MFKKFLVSVSCFVAGIMSCNIASAYEVELQEEKCYKNWCSAYFYDNGERTLRMSTEFTGDNEENIVLVVDFSEDMETYTSQVIATDFNNSKIDDTDIFVDTRIDKNAVFQTTGVLSASDGNFFIDLGSGFGERFIRESIKGNTVRIKLSNNDSNPIYLNFSLYGFTAAFKRLISMASIPDSAFF